MQHRVEDAESTEGEGGSQRRSEGESVQIGRRAVTVACGFCFALVLVVYVMENVGPTKSADASRTIPNMAPSWLLPFASSSSAALAHPSPFRAWGPGRIELVEEESPQAKLKQLRAELQRSTAALQGTAAVDKNVFGGNHAEEDIAPLHARAQEETSPSRTILQPPHHADTALARMPQDYSVGPMARGEEPAQTVFDEPEQPEVPDKIAEAVFGDDEMPRARESRVELRPREETYDFDADAPKQQDLAEQEGKAAMWRQRDSAAPSSEDEARVRGTAVRRDAQLRPNLRSRRGDAEERLRGGERERGAEEGRLTAYQASMLDSLWRRAARDPERTEGTARGARESAREEEDWRPRDAHARQPQHGGGGEEGSARMQGSGALAADEGRRVRLGNGVLRAGATWRGGEAEGGHVTRGAGAAAAMATMAAGQRPARLQELAKGAGPRSRAASEAAPRDGGVSEAQRSAGGELEALEGRIRAGERAAVRLEESPGPPAPPGPPGTALARTAAPGAPTGTGTGTSGPASRTPVTQPLFSARPKPLIVKGQELPTAPPGYRAVHVEIPVEEYEAMLRSDSEQRSAPLRQLEPGPARPAAVLPVDLPVARTPLRVAAVAAPQSIQVVQPVTAELSPPGPVQVAIEPAPDSEAPARAASAADQARERAEMARELGAVDAVLKASEGIAAQQSLAPPARA